MNLWSGPDQVRPENTLIVAQHGGDYTTIQDAVDAARSGYCIEVAPGTYNEDIDLTGKSNICIDAYSSTINMINGFTISDYCFLYLGKTVVPANTVGFTYTGSNYCYISHKILQLAGDTCVGYLGPGVSGWIITHDEMVESNSSGLMVLYGDLTTTNNCNYLASFVGIRSVAGTFIVTGSASNNTVLLEGNSVSELGGTIYFLYTDPSNPSFTCHSKINHLDVSVLSVIQNASQTCTLATSAITGSASQSGSPMRFISASDGMSVKKDVDSNVFFEIENTASGTSSMVGGHFVSETASGYIAALSDTHVLTAYAGKFGLVSEAGLGVGIGGSTVDLMTGTFTQETVRLSVNQYGKIREPWSSGTSLTGNTNNYDLSQKTSCVKVGTNGSYNITGIVAGGEGEYLTLMNTSGSEVTTIMHEDSASSAANRITTFNGADIALNPNDTIQLQYDTAISRWRQIGGKPS